MLQYDFVVLYKLIFSQYDFVVFYELVLGYRTRQALYSEYNRELLQQGVSNLRPLIKWDHMLNQLGHPCE